MEQLTNRAALPARGRERGAVLFLALIALVAMTIAALALVRAVDTANVISGNFAFKQSTLQMADIGIEAAVTALPTITTTSLDAAWSSSGACTTACQYYPTMAASTDTKGKPLTADANGVIYTIDWSSVPTVASPISGYEIRYVINESEKILHSQRIRVVGMHLDLSGIRRRHQIRAVLDHLTDCDGDLPTVVMGETRMPASAATRPESA